MILVASSWQWLEVPGGNNVVGQRPPHAHALLLVDQQAVLLHLDVRLQLLLSPHSVIKLDVAWGRRGSSQLHRFQKYFTLRFAVLHLTTVVRYE